MALKLVKQLTTGVSVEYWRISPDMRLNTVDQEVEANLLAYVSEATRRQGCACALLPDFSDPPPSRTVVLRGASAVEAVKTGDPRAAMYLQLKQTQYFSGAEDLL